MGNFAAPITIKNAIDKIDSNKYLIPAFQREFVWSQEQIENLFDSLMRGYPISSMLFWEVTGNSRKAYQYYQFLQNFVEKHQIHNQPKAGCDSMESFCAVLDGQQRLTSLFLGLKGTVAYHAKYKSWENDDKNFPPMKLYLNLSHEEAQNEGNKKYDFKFRQADDNQWNDLVTDEHDNKWFRVGAILTIDSLLDFSNKYGLVSSEYKILERLHKVIINENVINYYLETEVAADKAVDIFVRINSGGRSLSISDILLSIVVAGWKKQDARKEIQNLIEQVSGKGFKINHDYVIKSFQYLLDKPVQSKITTFNGSFVGETEQKWSNIKECILSLFSLLKVYGLTDATLTSYNATMPILFYLYKRDIYKDFSTSIAQKDHRAKIKKWLLKTLLLKSFGGSSDSTLEQARRSIDTKASEFPGDIISKGIKQPTLIDQTTIDEILSTQKDQTYAFTILALFYPNIDLSNKFNLDHMHPAALFDQYYAALKEPRDKKECWSRYNSIVNLQMLVENENKSKNDLSLDKWVEQLHKDRQSLQRETYLPANVDLAVENFDEFYIERKRLLTAKLCEELGITVGIANSSPTFNSGVPIISSSSKRSFGVSIGPNEFKNLSMTDVAVRLAVFLLEGGKTTDEINLMFKGITRGDFLIDKATYAHKTTDENGEMKKKEASRWREIPQYDGWYVTTQWAFNKTDASPNPNFPMLIGKVNAELGDKFQIREELDRSISSQQDDNHSLMQDVIKVEYESPWNSFGPQTPLLSVSYDYSTGEFSYSYGGLNLNDEQIQTMIAFLKNKDKVRAFFAIGETSQGATHTSIEYLTITYGGQRKQISQDILRRTFRHPFHTVGIVY